MTNKLAYADDRFHDECGVFGVFGHPEAANLTYLGLYALQHRGQESAGIVSSTGSDLHLHRAMGEVEEIFQPSVLAKLPGSSAIGHTRYSTAGDKALLNAQPIMIDCNKGKIAVAHNGNLTNALEHRRRSGASRIDLPVEQRYGSDRAFDCAFAGEEFFRRVGRCAESGGRCVFSAGADAGGDCMR